ncbi:MAG: ABC-F family ATP-binding cassette domain-containing protein [Waddliaceae bacterium]|nr:ABC-F family ATP-binding cassette domain-containing protein [Waddliaceae bacterium]MBT3578842.1 ABC-F family ATP-binding cassette domain-containing protein [Waddliaceae bacterium]MBT4444632.1 ABC-F family ATP-binding cassette domain-containing protein [Waddliaceae bacterium]MBT6928806.1 ABC-F family ATP-binding cassette domain-containing protein [Waddliaceae bacterium]MBT7263853.1 ABC-F family ATP-binding cassette domain-containing protein [Waddliaceae bacterium]
MHVEGISKSYGGRTLFSDVSFTIGKGERCALVGSNGSGKTTLLKILSGAEEEDSGKIRIPKGLRIGELPQHLRFEEGTLVEEALLGLPKEIRDEKYRVEKILSGLGFSEEDFSMPPNSFSGGYQLRLALTKVLAGEPDLLLLDEPTNYLDIVAIRWLEKYLRAWRGQILFISHDRSFVDALCTHVIGIGRGAMTKIAGNLEKYHTTISLQEETYERTREKIEKKKEQMISFVKRFGAKATKASQAQSRMKALEKMETLDTLQHERDLAFSFHYKKCYTKKVLSAHNLFFSYNASEKLIENLTFEIGNGEHIAIIGKNGRGKSTILKLLSDMLTPSSGEVVAGNNVIKAYFGQQDIAALDMTKTIEEEIVDAIPTAAYDEIRSVCGTMLFTGDDVKKTISILSGGERSRVLLAKIMLTPANVLILDEPTHHLDIASIEALMDAIERFPGTVIMVSHDEAILHRFKANKIVICNKSRQQTFLGDYSTFLDKIGWDDDATKTKTFDGKKVSAKEERRLRAEILAARNLKLRPIKKRMEVVEARITALEEEKQSLEIMLVNVAQENGDDMGHLTRKHGLVNKEIETFYSQLDDLMCRKEEIEKTMNT